MENIEIRSENVRKIIGQIPPKIIRSGITVIGLIILLLLTAVAFIPYPETLKAEVTVENYNNIYINVKGTLPYSSVNQVKEGMNVEIEFEGFSAREYGYLHATISSVSPEVIMNGAENFFSFNIKLGTDACPFIQKGMKGYASVILSNKTLLRRILD